ncbi:MAG: pyridoxamine 5'-phosphate oxidase family protein [Dehalococcoidales bacterium]
MDKKEILEFITKNPVAYMATTEGSKPHVRAMGTYKANEKDGIIFSMQAVKDVYKQIAKNPEVELCYFANGVQVRVAGKFDVWKQMTDAQKEEMLKIRPFLKPQVDANGWDYVKVMTLKNAKATVLDMSKPVDPAAHKEWVTL